MRILYDIGVRAWHLLIRIAAASNPKAKSFVQGRKNWQERLAKEVQNGNPIVWIHCASLGEFEQGRPLIEALRQSHPEHRILLTFYSPSGYEIRKDYPHADWIYYLPVDSARNAKTFMNLVQPQVAIFVKYEYWYHYLKELKKRAIPTFMVSAFYRPDQHFFKWYGGWFRKMLHGFSHLYVQDDRSLELLQSIGVTNATQTGDTRFDRVFTITEKAHEVPIMENFKQDSTVVIAGSSWPKEEQLLVQYFQLWAPHAKCIIAPHEVDRERIDELMAQLPPTAIRYSEATAGTMKASNILVIDNIGMLSNLYQYAEIAVIGGGFGRGIHNTLEAATFGLPVVIGPNYEKFKEAVDLVKLEAAFTVQDYNAFEAAMNHLLQEDNHQKAGAIARQYVVDQKGATDRILRAIQPHLQR